MDTRALKPLIGALEGGYRYRSHDTFSFFFSALFSLWGLKADTDVPVDAQASTREAIEAYAALVERHPFDDVLGPVYMELASHGNRAQFAQFFTPMPVALMMAKMSLGSPARKDGGDLIRVIDPACGSGVMMLAAAQEVFYGQGADALLRYSLTGVDLDRTCAKMMATQFMANCSIHDVKIGEVVVYHGNSLFPDQMMNLLVHATAPGQIEGVPAMHPARLAAIADAANAPAAGQLSLFAA